MQRKGMGKTPAKSVSHKVLSCQLPNVSFLLWATQFLEVGSEMIIKIPGTSRKLVHWDLERAHSTRDTFFSEPHGETLYMCGWCSCTYAMACIWNLKITSGCVYTFHLEIRGFFAVLPMCMPGYFAHQPLGFFYFCLSAPHRIIYTCYAPGFYIGQGDFN